MAHAERGECDLLALIGGSPIDHSNPPSTTERGIVEPNPSYTKPDVAYHPFLAVIKRWFPCNLTGNQACPLADRLLLGRFSTRINDMATAMTTHPVVVILDRAAASEHGKRVTGGRRLTIGIRETQTRGEKKASEES